MEEGPEVQAMWRMAVTSPVRVVEKGMDSVGHTRMGIVTTPIASMKGHFLLVVV
jgi:hypothetical protein